MLVHQKKTYASSLEEINQMLEIFPKPAATALAVAAFAALRRGGNRRLGLA